MAYRFDTDNTRSIPQRVHDIGHAAIPAANKEVRAGAGACNKCGCQQFERWGANADQCGNSSCAHSWSDHW